MELQVPIPTIDVAVAMRNMSSVRKGTQKKPVASCRDLFAVLQAIARCSSANCGAPSTPG